MISKSELKQLIKEMLMSELAGINVWPEGDKPRKNAPGTPGARKDDFWGKVAGPAFTDVTDYEGEGEADYVAPEWSAAAAQKTDPRRRGHATQRGGSVAGQERSKEALHGLSGAESMTQDEYDLLHGTDAAKEKQIADIESGGTGWVPGDVPPPTDTWYTEDEVGKTVPEERRGKEREDDKKPDPKPDPKPKPNGKKKGKKKREDAEAENEAVDAAKNELAKMAAEQQWTAEQAAVKAKALASAQTLFGAMRGWGTDEAAINMALTSASGEEGLPEVYDAYDEILQQAIRMGIADANDGDLTQWLKDDGMDEWATQVAQANITRRRSLAGSAAEAARTAAGEAASVGGAAKTAAALQERTTYSSYPDQHKLFENWNKFVKSTKE
jgi:hypothetical protein